MVVLIAATLWLAHMFYLAVVLLYSTLWLVPGISTPLLKPLIIMSLYSIDSDRSILFF
ncbi:hypothetical protein BDF14DRAFT_1780928 [Spinellus fusiger]|nr:hypothetical protein BDF14DRAFT_1780928 [Spinellus fusiger]